MIKLEGTEKIQKIETNLLNDPMVSVCVQTYNHGSTIAQCLDSILSQKTEFEYEILIGEDDSKDDTRAICLQYAEKYPDKIRLFLHDRSNVIYIDGYATGRYNLIYNLNSSRGKYIALCEGDDFWCDNSKLSKQISFLEQNKNFEICFHNSNLLNDKGIIGTFRPVYTDFKEQIVNVEDQISHRVIGHTSSAVFRKSAVNLPKWFLKVTSGDMGLFTLILSTGHGFFLNQVMSTYRVEFGVTSRFKGMKIFYDILKLNHYLNKQLKNRYLKTFREVNHKYYKSLVEREKLGTRYFKNIVQFLFRNDSSTLRFSSRIIFVSKLLSRKRLFSFFKKTIEN